VSLTAVSQLTSLTSIVDAPMLDPAVVAVAVAVADELAPRRGHRTLKVAAPARGPSYERKRTWKWFT